MFTRRGLLCGLTAGTSSVLITGCTAGGTSSAPSTGPSSPPASGSPATSPSVDGTPTPESADVVTTVARIPRQAHRLTDGRVLLSDQHGLVHVLADSEARSTPMLDISSTIMPPTRQSPELGLAAFALAPDFERSGTVYTYSSESPRGSDKGSDRVDVLRRWKADRRDLQVDTSSGVELLRVAQKGFDHVGSNIVFDSQGLLHLGIGTPDSDKQKAEDPTSLWGTTIRLDVSGDRARPAAGNPWATKGGRPEIFSLGYRNPFRLQWDAAVGLIVTAPMWVQKAQQVVVPVAGSNIGYPGTTYLDRPCWDAGKLDELCVANDKGDRLTPPVVEYDSEIGRIVSGALVVRKSRLASVNDKLVVADWEGRLLLATPQKKAPWPWVPLGETARVAGDEVLWDIAQVGDEVWLMVTTKGFSSGRVVRLAA